MTHNPNPPSVPMPCDRCGGITRLPDGHTCLVLTAPSRAVRRRHRAAAAAADAREALAKPGRAA